MPIFVPMPPMFEPYATESISAAPNPPSRSWRCSSSCFTSAIPIGTIITAVAVFEIHRLTAAVATSIPSSSRFGSVPTRRMISSAILRCRFHCSIAPPIAIPPMKRKMYASA